MCSLHKVRQTIKANHHPARRRQTTWPDHFALVLNFYLILSSSLSAIFSCSSHMSEVEPQNVTNALECSKISIQYVL